MENLHVGGELVQKEFRFYRDIMNLLIAGQLNGQLPLCLLLLSPFHALCSSLFVISHAVESEAP